MTQILLKIILISVLLVPSPAYSSKSASKALETPEQLLEESQQLFYKNDHDGALSVLKKYFNKVITQPKQRIRTKLRFLAISAMGRIYLQYKKDPAAAVEWFEKIKKTEPLSEAEQDILSGWIAAAQDWIKLGKFPESIQSETELFEIGKKYYDSGIQKQKFTMDPAGAADFSIASSFLVPFMVHYDKSKKIGDALFMMGDMRRRLWTSNRYWSENYYLTEAIRRFPNSPLAIKSYTALAEDIEFAYSGSSGNNTPQSWKDLLGTLRRMAHGIQDEVPTPTPVPKPKLN
jgi:tetratricopeptide (TPR) repeat protein